MAHNGDGSLGGADGDEHGHLLAILGVLFVKTNQVALLELDRNENVGGGAEGEDQMRYGHHRRCPEHQQPSYVERVADDTVHSGSAEGKAGVGDAAEIQPDLAETKQIEMIDEKTRGQNDEHAQTKQSN